MKLVDDLKNFLFVGSRVFLAIGLLEYGVIPVHLTGVVIIAAMCLFLVLAIWRAQRIAKTIASLSLHARLGIKIDVARRMRRRNQLVLSFLPITLPASIAAAGRVSPSFQWMVAIFGLAFGIYLYLLNRNLAARTENLDEASAPSVNDRNKCP